MSSESISHTKKLLLGVTAVLVSTIALSYQLQKLHHIKYPSTASKQSHHFQYPSLVTWLGCLFCAIYGSIYAAVAESKPNCITLKERMRLGLLFTLNYLPTNYSLLYISYPLQVITKNTRYILVVIVGVFFSRVPHNRSLKLPTSKIYIATLITFGAALFMYFEPTNQSKQNHFQPQKKWIGFVLLLVAIVFDAFFSDSQAYCKSTFKPTQNQLFLASNLYGFVFIFLFAILNGQLHPSLSFCVSHPAVILDVLTIASLQIVSQVSIYYVISNFKQHIYPLISTIRKILTILISIFAFNHKVKSLQWIAIAIVFLAMAYELYDQIFTHEQNIKVKMERTQSKRKNQSIRQMDLERESSKGGYHRDSPREQGSNNKDSQNKDAPSKDKAESLQQYGYQWRRQEVAENLQTSTQ